MRRALGLIVGVSVVAGAAPLTCKTCHPKEVQGYSEVAMSHSLRGAMHEPSGAFQAASGSTFRSYWDGHQTWQVIEQSGKTVSEFPVAFVIGSGNHASGYLVRMGDHLFQSPMSYYAARHAYGLAPGYEKLPDPDFTRPVTEECLLCHSGKLLKIPETLNRYESPAFAQEAISCERCHGDPSEHLKRPVPGTMVNPAKLTGAARDSICEQCHLSGLARVPNPNARIADFHPGQPLEEVFTVYRQAAPAGAPPGAFKVISHSEQLAASACARNSHGRLWCGTCHDPHNKPTESTRTAYFRERCLTCHAGKLAQAHPAPESLDCVQCHMPKRPVSDGGHTTFTDHRISRNPDAQPPIFKGDSELAPWREPDRRFAKRNLALAYVNAGVERNSPAWIVRGYRMLTEIQADFSSDEAVFQAFGTALLLGNQPGEATVAFKQALRLDPSSSSVEEDLGRALLASGDIANAIGHLERALELDPLLVSAADLLENIYKRQGDAAKADAIADRLRKAIARGASHDGNAR